MGQRSAFRDVWKEVDRLAGAQGIVKGTLENGAVVAAANLVRRCSFHRSSPRGFDVALQLDAAQGAFNVCCTGRRLAIRRAGWVSS